MNRLFCAQAQQVAAAESKFTILNAALWVLLTLLFNELGLLWPFVVISGFYVIYALTEYGAVKLGWTRTQVWVAFFFFFAGTTRTSADARARARTLCLTPTVRLLMVL